MANVTERFGLRPSRQLNGSPFINAQNRYRVLNTNVTSIFQGDLVAPTADGTVVRTVANTSATSVGVFNGCFYTDPTTQKPTFSNFYPQSTNASDITAFVIDGPDTVFEVNANAVFAVADLFQNYSINNVSGNMNIQNLSNPNNTNVLINPETHSYRSKLILSSGYIGTNPADSFPDISTCQIITKRRKNI
jgi:hypothetical protein